MSDDSGIFLDVCNSSRKVIKQLNIQASEDGT